MKMKCVHCDYKSNGGITEGYDDEVLNKKTGDFLEWDLSTLSNAFIKRELSPVEVTRTLLDRIRLYDGELNTYITVLEEEALAEARKAEEEMYAGKQLGVLHGIPIGLKDMIFTKG